MEMSKPPPEAPPRSQSPGPGPPKASVANLWAGASRTYTEESASEDEEQVPHKSQDMSEIDASSIEAVNNMNRRVKIRRWIGVFVAAGVAYVVGLVLDVGVNYSEEEGIRYGALGVPPHSWAYGFALAFIMLPLASLASKLVFHLLKRTVVYYYVGNGRDGLTLALWAGFYAWSSGVVIWGSGDDSTQSVRYKTWPVLVVCAVVGMIALAKHAAINALTGWIASENIADVLESIFVERVLWAILSGKGSKSRNIALPSFEELQMMRATLDNKEQRLSPVDTAQIMSLANRQIDIRTHTLGAKHSAESRSMSGGLAQMGANLVSVAFPVVQREKSKPEVEMKDMMEDASGENTPESLARMVMQSVVGKRDEFTLTDLGASGLLPATAVARAFSALDVSGDGIVQYEEVKDAINSIMRGRLLLKQQLSSQNTIRETLGMMMNMLFVIAAALIAVPLAFPEQSLGVLLSLGSILAGSSVIFGAPLTALVQSIIMLFIARPFRLGDAIQLEETQGETYYFVVNVGLRRITLQRLDGRVVDFPVLYLVNQPITNLSRSSPVRLILQMKMHHTTSDAVMQSLRREVKRYAERHDAIMDAEHVWVWLSDLHSTRSIRMNISVPLRNKMWGDFSWFAERDRLYRFLRGWMKGHGVQWFEAVQPVLIREEKNGNPGSMGEGKHKK